MLIGGSVDVRCNVRANFRSEFSKKRLGQYLFREGQVTKRRQLIRTAKTSKLEQGVCVSEVF